MELILDPKSGLFVPENSVSQTTSTAPRRSWRAADDKADSYDFKFEFEGATVYARYAKDLPAIESEQESLVDAARTLQAKANALVKAQSENKVSLEQLKPLESQLKEETASLSKRQSALARNIVTQCVVTWTDGPFSYSPEEIAGLHNAICSELANIIIEQSRLSQSEANFLPTSSQTSSPGDE